MSRREWAIWIVGAVTGYLLGLLVGIKGAGLTFRDLF